MSPVRRRLAAPLAASLALALTAPTLAGATGWSATAVLGPRVRCPAPLRRSGLTCVATPPITAHRGADALIVEMRVAGTRRACVGISVATRTVAGLTQACATPGHLARLVERLSARDAAGLRVAVFLTSGSPSRPIAPQGGPVVQRVGLRLLAP